MKFPQRQKYVVFVAIEGLLILKQRAELKSSGTDIAVVYDF